MIRKLIIFAALTAATSVALSSPASAQNHSGLVFSVGFGDHDDTYRGAYDYNQPQYDPYSYQQREAWAARQRYEQHEQWERQERARQEYWRHQREEQQLWSRGDDDDD